MDGGDVLGFVVLAFAVLGVVASCSDVRHFSSIERSCEKHGYVQNDTTRITCSVDPKPKAKDAQ